MEWLNYHHLLYFWSVVREGSLSRASEKLRLAQSTVSKQIHQFEEVLGHELFTKSGRRLVLTDSGRVVFRYADEIFNLGREMLGTLSDRPIGKPIRVTVGLADVVPKTVAERVLAPALEFSGPTRLICKEGKQEPLLSALALHELDVVLSDTPAGPDSTIRAFNHLLGESDISFFGTEALARKYRRGFPSSLSDAPLLLPTENTALRRSIDHWLDAEGLRARIVGEFEDSALLNVFGQRGGGLFPAVSILSSDIEAQYKVKTVGRIQGIKERLFAITVDRKIKHPVVDVICEKAKSVFLKTKTG